jgi:aldehyde dehydrogenase (NAD+)
MPSQLKIIQSHIDDAIAKGGKALLGGEGAVGDRFVQPTILAHVPEDSLAVQEETFGPTLVVNKVANMDEALRLTNATKYGLAGSVYGKRNALDIASKVRSGMTSVNSVITFAAIPALPFGGVGESGFGRIHGADGLREFTYPKALVKQFMPPALTLMTFERTKKAEQLFEQLISSVHGGVTNILKR